MPQTSLDDIMSGRDPAPVDTPEPSEADRAANPFGAADRARDEAGRFARQQQEEQSEPHAEGEGDEPQADPQRRPGTVPKQALDAARGKAREREDENAALRREIAELRGAVMARQQPPAAPQQTQTPTVPEFWVDPNAATDYRVRSAVDPVMQRMDDMRLAMSQRFALTEHGSEAVQDAVQALSQLRTTDPGAYTRLEQQANTSMDPVGDVVRWHKQQHALATYGADPEAYIKAEVERRLAEAGAQQHQPEQQQPATRQPARLPSSFAGAPAGGPRGGAGYGGPRPLSEIMPRG